MPTVNRCAIILALMPMLAGIPACTPTGPPTGTYTINAFQFVPANPPQNTGESVPNIWIDTNAKLSSLSGGTLTSSLPCAVKIDYTDNGLSFKNAVITVVKVTYDDDTVDPSSEAVKLPLPIAANEYESVNSVAGGRIVKSKNRIMSGKIPNVITRAEPFRLQMEGYFTKDDGTRLPFKIDQHFDIKSEYAVKDAAEVLQDK
jgi:hypothetical protein